MKRIEKMLLSILLIASMSCTSVLAATTTDFNKMNTNAKSEATASVTSVGVDSVIASTFQSWCYTQLYGRLLSTAGSMMMSVSQYCSDSDEFQTAMSYVNTLVFGGSSTGSDVAEIKEMCAKILLEVQELEELVENGNKDISTKLANMNKEDMYTLYTEAWEADVEACMESSGAPNYRKVHDAFKDYMKYAQSCESKTVLSDSDHVVTESEVTDKRDNLFEQFTQMSEETYDKTETKLDRDDFYKNAMFLSDDIDKQIISVLDDLLKAMQGSGNEDNKTRYIDRAAQVAYNSLPYSSQQAQFVDNAVQRQLTEIGIVLMVWQEFQAQRAEYFQELYDEKSIDADDEVLENYGVSLNNFYIEMRDLMVPYFTGKATNGGIQKVVDKWLNGKIYLEGTLDGRYIYLDSYVREESTKDITVQTTDDSYLAQTDWAFYANESANGYLDYRIKEYYDSGTKKDGTSTPNFVKKENTFKRDAIVVANKSGEVSVVPVYLMTADSLGTDNFYLKKFDYNYENTFGVSDCHVPTVDYYNLVRGTYTDGLNTFKCLSSSAQLKSLLTNNYYASVGNSPYKYLESLMTNEQYADNPLHLLINTGTTDSRHGFADNTAYAVFRTLDISDGKSYSLSDENWDLATVDQYDLQDNRDEDDVKNSMYAVMLMNGEEEYRSNIQTTVIGTGSYEVSYEAAAPYDAASVEVETTEAGIQANAGKSVTVNVKLSDQQTIREVYVEYFDDAGMTHSCGKEKLVSDYATNLVKYGEDGNAQIHFRVPYAHVKLTIYTECAEYDNGICPTCKEYEAPSTTTIDGKEYYEISNAGQLYWFAALVNNDQTHAKFDKSNISENAILRDNVYLEGITDRWPSIGMNGEQYAGTFDGDGYGIFSLNGNVDRDNPDYDNGNPGLFNVIGAEGKVQNLIVDDAYVWDTCYMDDPEHLCTAVIAAVNYGSIDSVLVKNSVIDSSLLLDCKGGIAGKNGTGGKITNCAVVDTDICAYLYPVGGICAKNYGTVQGNHTYQCRFLSYGPTTEHGAIIAEQSDTGISSSNYYYTDSEVSADYGEVRTKEEFKNQKVLSDFVNSSGYDGSWYQDDTMDYPVPVKEKYNECTVTYVLNGGEENNNPTTLEKGKTVNLQDPVKKGYDFEGWYLEDTFKTKCESITGNQRAITLYAKWGGLSNYTITYELNGGTNAKENPASYRIDSEDIILADAVRDDYTFLGWFTDEACTQKVTLIPKGSYGDIVLYAGWELLPTLDKEGDHYVISSYEDLMAMAYLCETEPDVYASASYVQTQNINCGMGAWELAIGSEEHPFVGTYNGQGNYIAGLRPTEQVSGLFGVIGTGGYVKNVYVVDFDYEKPAEHAGGLAGINYGTIDSCGSGAKILLNIFVERENGEKVSVAELNSVIRGTKVAGGLVAINEGIIENSSSKADVVIEASDNEETYAGGLAGKNMGTIKNVCHTGSVTGGTYSGGIAGSHSAGTSGTDAVIQYGYNAGTISGKYTGGIVALCKNTNIKDMYYASTSETAAYSLEDASLGVTKMELADMKKESFVTVLNDLIADTGYSTWTLNAKLNNGYPRLGQDNSEANIIESVRQGVFGTIDGTDDMKDTGNSNISDTGDKSQAVMWMMIVAASLVIAYMLHVMNNKRQR